MKEYKCKYYKDGICILDETTCEVTGETVVICEHNMENIVISNKYELDEPYY